MEGHTWVIIQYILGIAAVVGALGIIWSKIMRPGARLITTTEEMVPMLRDLNGAFRGTPHAFEVLDEIVAQFRTDSGSSLRDVVNRLEVAATANREAGEVLKVGVESAKQLAQQDREALVRLMVLLDRLTIRVDAGTAATSRIEQHASDVASDLARAHARADATSGLPGVAADAAAQQTAKEKREEGNPIENHEPL